MHTTVTEHHSLGEDWYDLEVHSPDLAPRCRSGQFVQVRVGTGDDPLVRRPFSVYDVAGEEAPDRLRILYQAVGPGTRWMTGLRSGDPVDLLGPLGNPFPTPPCDHLLLVGGGIGVAPLYFHARSLTATGFGGEIHVFLGARYEALLVGKDAFQDLPVHLHVATDDGSAGFHGNVVQLLEQRTEGLEGEIFGLGCGPHGMNLALRNHAVTRDLDFWISLENYMPCGFGACFGCVLPSPDGGGPYRRVCVEGPAFPAREIPEHF